MVRSLGDRRGFHCRGFFADFQDSLVVFNCCNRDYFNFMRSVTSVVRILELFIVNSQMNFCRIIIHCILVLFCLRLCRVASVPVKLVFFSSRFNICWLEKAREMIKLFVVMYMSMCMLYIDCNCLYSGVVQKIQYSLQTKVPCNFCTTPKECCENLMLY